MAATVCPYCTAGGDELEFENGVLTCNRCGQQLQGLQEETEFQQGIDDVSGRRAAAGTSNARYQLTQAAQIAREEEAAAQQLKDATLLYVRCLQKLLQAQGDTLHTRFGVSTQITQLLRQMWLTLLPQTGILEPAPQAELSRYTTAQAATGTPAAGGAESGDEGIPVQQHMLAGMSSAKLLIGRFMKQLFWKMCHPQVTLQLCFIGCVRLREAITHQDIISWAVDGRLPFLQLPALAKETLAPGVDLSCLPTRCIQPQLAHNPASFLRKSCLMAKQLGIQLPPVAGDVLLLRTIRELALPQIAYEASLQLYLAHLMHTQGMNFVTEDYPTQGHVLAPYVWLGGVLVIALKMLYGLGGSSKQSGVMAKAAGPPGGWQAWAQHVLQAMPGISSLPLSEEEAVALGPEEVKEYFRFCRAYMFAGQPVMENLNDAQRLLLSWYERSGAARDQPQQQACGPAVQVPAAGANVVDSSQQHQSMTDQQQQQQGEAGDEAELPAGAMGCKANTYNMLVLGADNNSSSIRLEPDLKAIFVVVAAYYRVSQEDLVGCVKKLEGQVAAAEAALAWRMAAG